MQAGWGTGAVGPLAFRESDTEPQANTGVPKLKPTIEVPMRFLKVLAPPKLRLRPGQDVSIVGLSPTAALSGAEGDGGDASGSASADKDGNDNYIDLNGVDVTLKLRKKSEKKWLVIFHYQHQIINISFKSLGVGLHFCFEFQENTLY